VLGGHVGRTRSESVWWLLGAYLRPQWRRSALLALLVLAAIALELANPQILRAFIDAATHDTGLEQLALIALIFLLVALAAQAVAVAETYVAENVGLSATNALRADLTRHCLGLDPDFHTSHTPGELIERIDGDVNTLANFFARFVIYVVGNSLLILGLLVLVAQVDGRLGLVLGAGVLLGLLVMNRLRSIAVPHWSAARQASAELFGFLEERLQGTEDIRASGATSYVLRRFHERSRRLLRRELLAGVIGGAGFQSSGFILSASAAAALGLSALLYLNGAISLGSVYLVFAYTQILGRPLDQITRQMQDLQQAGAGLARVRHLFGITSRLAEGPLALPPGPLAVELDGVTFGYVPDEPILSNLSLRLEAGQVLGLLGRTGIGKSTLGKLLLRLYDPQAGTIRLGGCDLRQVQVASLRQRVGVVTQDVQLFNTSVRDNLSLFDPTVPDAHMLEILHELGLGDWLAHLPDGLATRLAPGGSSLSAGEAQLLAFARVFLADPGLVILDEASSRLDPATERRIERAIDRLLAGRTGIVIAHRLHTIQRVDHVLILEPRGITEYGPRAALAADPASGFSALLRAGGLLATPSRP